MIITLIIVTLSLIITVVLIHYSKTDRPTHPLVGKWQCYSHNPYIDCFRWSKYAEKKFPTPFTITLFENGNGVFNNERTKRLAYFSWICENGYVIIEPEGKDETAHIYLEIVEFENGNWCEVKICKNRDKKQAQQEG